MRTTSRGPHLLGLVALLMSALALPMATSAQTPTCTDYSSQAAAQFALDINPNLASSLDPDGNGIACDDAAGAAQTPSSTERQLPTDQAEAPPTSSQAQPATGQQQPTTDVIDGQPTQPSTQPQTAILGVERTNIEAVYGQPTREIARANDPNTTSAAYAGSGSISDMFVVYHNNRVIILLLQAVQPWTSQEASNVITGFVPADVTTLPQPEQIMEGTFLMTVNSLTLASSPSVLQVVSNAGLPGAPGDMYLLLTTNAEQKITDIEIGLGNGDNVREELTGGQTTTGPTPTIITTTTAPTPATGTTTDSTAFLQQARSEVDQLQAEIAELRTILGKEAFTQADITRVYEITEGWMALDSTPISAPPEHAALADQLTSIRADLSNAGEIIFAVISIGDTSRVQEAADAINRADQNLAALDQQLTALGT